MNLKELLELGDAEKILKYPAGRVAGRSRNSKSNELEQFLHDHPGLVKKEGRAELVKTGGSPRQMYKSLSPLLILA
jgi:hypothetical protein